MKRSHKEFRLLACMIIVAGVVIGHASDKLHAYVLPPEQLLQFMAAHFSKFDTLVIEHSVTREDQEGVKEFGEILTMKSPDLFHVHTGDPSLNRGRAVERSYRRLFLASTWSRISILLADAGVDTEKVSLTRVDGTVAYLIGDRLPDRPRLAVEKARFLPLLFVYPSRLSGSSDLMEVTFRDYRQVDSGWYPFETVCSSSSGWAERYKVQSVKVNVPVQPSLFLQGQEDFRPSESPAGEGKIDAIIKTFEERYGQ